MGMLEYESGGVEQTQAFGMQIAAALQPGVLITLKGTLGAGKTNLVQAIAAGLEIDRSHVNSPTFALIQIHQGRLQLVHIDAYRIADDDQYLELGIDEYIDSPAVVAMEWAEKFTDLIPADRLAIEIEVADETRRLIRLTWPDSESTASTASTVGRKLSQAMGG